MEIGTEVTVRVKEIDDQGRVNLSMKGIDDNAKLWENNKGMQAPGAGHDFRSGGDRSRGPRPSGDPGEILDQEDSKSF